ncbi:MAG: ribosome small subunit-dependent GTPase A [Lachnospiraceae bacterium]|nr:ribosome small subunit-dependent GTPase A [Lachnospiraceae bacterium]
MEGRIIKGIAGFYYVACEDGVIYECKAKGVFRKDHKKPLVGDRVTVDVVDAQTATGNVTSLLPRVNELLRPAVANVDQAVIIFATTHPEPNMSLLNRFLVRMEFEKIPTVICFNKSDLMGESEKADLRANFAHTPYPVLFTCAKTGEGLEELKQCLAGKVSTVAGPSGVGKSSLINCLQSETVMETGTVSKKAERGRHTTRHAQLLPLDKETYIFDTPGFSSLELSELDEEDVMLAFPEIAVFQGKCKFPDCTHIHEPGCKCKEALSSGGIASQRYEDYVAFYEECKGHAKW